MARAVILCVNLLVYKAFKTCGERDHEGKLNFQGFFFKSVTLISDSVSNWKSECTRTKENKEIGKRQTSTRSATNDLSKQAIEFNGDKVDIWFLICVLGAIVMLPLHFMSVEHLKLQEKHGKEKGTRIGEILGLVSGWGFFIFWMGIWLSPQPRFTIPILQNPPILVSVVDFSVSLFHLTISILFLMLSVWLAINGVRETTLKASETHRTEKIVTEGVYSIVRHPQYLGGLLAHVGASFLLSALYSLMSTPLMIVLIYLISRKEEKELIREFGKKYEDYMKRVPMLMPRLRR